MNRRTFISAIAGLGAFALFRRIAKTAEPERLTVAQWAEKTRFKPGEIGPSIRMTPPTRIEPWKPIEGAIVELPAGWIFLSLDDGKTWDRIGTTPGGTIKTK